MNRARYRTAISISVLTMAMLTTLVPAVAATSEVAPSIEQCLFDKHNEERVARGIAPLVTDASLTEYAREWSFEMELTGFRHSDLSFPGSWRRRGENISWSQGYGTDCGVHHTGFMNSSGHRANILNEYYDRVGIGIVHDPSSGSIVWVTVVFGDSDGEKAPSPIPADDPPVPPWPESPCGAGTCDGVAGVDSGGRWNVYDLGDQDNPLDFYFGQPGDIPFMGDWNGDGTATPGLYRQSDGYVYLRNSNTQGTADYEFFFGDPGDAPLVGDWNGDGKDTVSIYRQSEGRVYVVNALGADGGGLGAAAMSFGFGNPGDQPFTGDFDGDGIDTIGLHRGSTGFVYFRNSLTTGVADLSFFYGDPGDQIIAGDWDGDGDDTVGVYRPSDGMVYLNMSNSAGTADWTAYVGPFTNLVTS